MTELSGAEVYIGVSAGKGNEFNTDLDSGLSTGLALGYQVNNHLAIEAGWVRIAPTYYDYTVINQSFYLGPVFHLPLLSNKASLYVKAAAASVDYKVNYDSEEIYSYSDIGLFLAAGSQFNLSDNISLFAGMQCIHNPYSGDSSDFSDDAYDFSAGLKLHF